MKRSTTQIRKKVMKLGRSLNVLNKAASDLNLQLLAAINTQERDRLQKKLRQTEQELQKVDKELAALEAEYQQAFEEEQQQQEASPAAGRDTDTALQPYLQWVFDLCSVLSLAGIDRRVMGHEQEARINLGAVYTELLTTGSAERDMLKAAGQKTAEEALEGQRKEQPLSALEQLHAHDRLVLLGDPGSGKSTFVNFVAMCLAEERLFRSPADSGQPAGLARLTALVAKDDDDETKPPQPPDWSFKHLIPVRIILRDFAARGLPPKGESATKEHVWAFLTREFQDAGLPPEIVTRVRSVVEQGGGLWLFDGLDEVPKAPAYRKQIKEVVDDCRKQFSHCRFVVTSRTYAYQNQGWNLEQFYVTKLADFNDAQIAYFVKHWYAHVGEIQNTPRDAIAEKRAKLERAIANSDRLKNFARLPLLLTLMISLHAWRGGSLPEKREDLYNDAVDLLLDWWESRRSLKDKSLTELLVVSKERLLQVLSALAFDVHKQQQDLSGTADIQEQELVSRLLAISDRPDLRPMVLANYFSEQRTGLLTPRGVGVYSFPHRTFQEYLAACALTDGDDFPDNVADEVHHDPERWREVALLAGAKAARGAKSSIWLLTNALCYEDLPWSAGVRPAEEADRLSAVQRERAAQNAWGALLAGQMLLESTDLASVSFRHQPKLERVRRWLVAILTEQVELKPGEPFPAVERALAGRLLAKLGDPRPGIGLRDDGLPEIAWCEVPAGEFTMGEGSDTLQVRMSAFEVSCYPITNAQYQVFVDDGGYTKEWRKCWTNDGWKEKEESNWDSPRRFRDPFGFPNHPVVGVSWYEAVAFCNWLTTSLHDSGELKEGMVVRLPSEAEWEYAARGPEGFIYPWGNEPKPEPELANYDETNFGETSAAGCFPRGKSIFFGCEEMAGNVWEWCLDVWHDTHKGAPTDGSAREEGEDVNLRLLKGGSWLIPSWWLRGAYRFRHWRFSGGYSWGFRVVRAVGGQYSDF